MKRLGVLVNPDAGLGGRLGFKGSDGRADEARQAGAEERAGPRMRKAISRLLVRLTPNRIDSVEWVIAGGRLGEYWLKEIENKNKNII